MLPLVTLKRKRAHRPAAAVRPRPRRSHGYHHGDLRAAAIDAALAALDAGQPLPSLRELAAACGVAHPSLYRHFESADALMLSVAAECFRAFAAEIAAATAGTLEPMTRLRRGCTASIRWGLAHPARYALMTGPELAGKQHHEEFFLAATGAFDSLVEGVALCGVPDPVPVAHTMMCAMHGLTDFLRKGRTIPHKAASLDQQIEAMVAMVVSYARARIAPGSS
jgi:AcrR family transcriptional regulator